MDLTIVLHGVRECKNKCKRVVFGKVSIIPNPRLLPLYKLREQMKIKNFERENILLALSQKNNKNLKAYLANIAKQFNNLDRYKLIIRPHPQSLITKSFIQEVESLSERFYVDPHFKEINNSFGDIVPMKEKRFRKDFDNRLFKLLEKTALIMTEGVITLDAALLNIPVIGLFINLINEQQDIFLILIIIPRLQHQNGSEQFSLITKLRKLLTH